MNFSTSCRTAGWTRDTGLGYRRWNQMKPQFRPIAFGSADHQNEIDLRSRVLRAPLGLKFSEADLKNEKSDHHLGAFIGASLIACLVLTPKTKSTVKMRQVAVEPDYQGGGVGRLLVEYSEKFAKEKGYSEIELSAREPVVAFYEKLGYETVGGTFLEVTIPHKKMRKRL